MSRSERGIFFIDSHARGSVQDAVPSRDRQGADAHYSGDAVYLLPSHRQYGKLPMAKQEEEDGR